MINDSFQISGRFTFSIIENILFENQQPTIRRKILSTNYRLIGRRSSLNKFYFLYASLTNYVRQSYWYLYQTKTSDAIDYLLVTITFT